MMKSLTGSLSQRAYLLKLLVRRNIKNQYYRSFIGVLWTVLNPLLNMLVMAFVFSTIFGRYTDGLDYPIYILSGNIIFNIMRSSTSSSLPCLVGQNDMLQKTKVPIEIFPTSNVLSSLVTFGFSFIALLIVAGFRALPIWNGTGAALYEFHWEIILVVFILPALVVFSLGISYFVSALYVFFRDLKHLYSVILTLWQYLTPLFYTIDRLGDTVAQLIQFNPMYHYVTAFRDMLMGTIPSAMTWLAMYGFAAISLVIGWFVLHLLKNNIAAYL